MRQFIVTGLIALLVGLGLGLYIGWVQYPVEYRNSHMCQLASRYQAEYTLMVARGYRMDGDVQKAVERLRPLRAEGKPECQASDSPPIDNIADWVQSLTERYISEGASQQQIRDLVALAEAFNRVTPIMESFRDSNPTPVSPP